MGDLNLKAASGGQIVLTPTNTASNFTLTLPAKTGNIITSADSGTVTQTMLGTNVAGNGPAFDAYYSGAGQSISASTNTKVTLNATNFNLGSCFDATTNYRFTPTVAGYYQFNAQVRIGALSSLFYLSFLRNGTTYFRTNSSIGNGLNATNTMLSAIIYLNGSTDYIELYCQAVGGTATTQTAAVGTNDVTWMNGALVRAG